MNPCRICGGACKGSPGKCGRVERAAGQKRDSGWQRCPGCDTDFRPCSAFSLPLGVRPPGVARATCAPTAALWQSFALAAGLVIWKLRTGGERGMVNGPAAATGARGR